MTKCEYCGVKNPPRTSTCTKCGAPLPDDAGSIGEPTCTINAHTHTLNPHTHVISLAAYAYPGQHTHTIK